MIGERRAGYRHEWATTPRAPTVDLAREHGLARAALAGQQHRHVRGCRLLRRRDRPLHRGARRLQEDVILHGSTEADVLAPQALDLEDALEEEPDLIHRERLHQV